MKIGKIAKMGQQTLLILAILVAIVPVRAVEASEKSVYEFKWLDPDKEVYVLQNRAFRKKHHLYVTGGFGPVINDTFLDAQNGQVRTGFFFSEEFGLELFGGTRTATENNAAASVKSVGGIPFYRNIQSYVGGLAVWSPFYAKINTFNRIVYVDLLLGLGFSSISEENNRQQLIANDATQPLQSENHTALAWDLGAKFYLNQNWHVRVDLLAQHYQTQSSLQESTSSDQDIYSHYDLTFALGYVF